MRTLNRWVTGSAFIFYLYWSGAWQIAYASTDAEVRMQDISQGSLVFRAEGSKAYRQVPLVSTDVDMDITGMILRSRLKQTFENTSDQWVEAIYAFPLPEQAAVDHMRIKVGNRIIVGQVKEKNQARKIYNKAKAAGKRAALTEQQRPNMFTNSIANIGPGETIVVEIEYQQLLQYKDGQYSFRFPMAMTPRYLPGKRIANDEARAMNSGWLTEEGSLRDSEAITPPVHAGKDKLNPVRMTITMESGFPLANLKSAYHAISPTQTEPGKYSIRFADEVVYAERDFVLSWTPEAGKQPRAALFSENKGTDSYHMLMVIPPERDNTQQKTLSREVVYIIDTSGSMSGTSLQQARKALLMGLDRLDVTSRFNIIQFNSVTSMLFKTSQMATPENISKAKYYVRQLDATGGTEMAPALQAALNNQVYDQDIRQVIFLTDGSVGNEAELFGYIKQHLGDSRLFTVGIGSAPNSYFMRKAAEFGRGTFSYIGDVNEVDQKMRTLFRKLESPLMSDLAVDFPGSQLVDRWPQRIPDLYDGEPLMVLWKSPGYGMGEVRIHGKRQNITWQKTFPMALAGSGKGISQLWARKKISELMDRQLTDDPKMIRQQVIELALDHHLVSKYTSLVAVDVTPVRPADESLSKGKVPVNLPKGQHYTKVLGRLPQTATPAGMQIVSGLLLLLLGWLAKWKLMSWRVRS